MNEHLLFKKNDYKHPQLDYMRMAMQQAQNLTSEERKERKGKEVARIEQAAVMASSGMKLIFGAVNNCV